MDTKKIMVGVAAGIVAGVVVGILFAPAKGSVTRRRLNRKGNGVIEDANDSFVDFSEALSDGFESIKKSADDMMEKGRNKLSTASWPKNSK
ncbi:MAG: YtxH domain-containing protein [Bacteroidetes bacterium]|nr:YtxH domain-containing protein [Bacteroidota bacterium]